MPMARAPGKNDQVERPGARRKTFGCALFIHKGAAPAIPLGAAGAIEAIYTLACLNLGKIPPSKGFEHPGSDMSLYTCDLDAFH